MKGEGKLKVETAQSGMTALEIKTEALEKAKNELLFSRLSKKKRGTLSRHQPPKTVTAKKTRTVK